jgi:multiple sugar transport system substrate-binding protein
VKAASEAISKTENAKDALASLLPIGLGTHGGEFDKVYTDAFQLIVLRGQPVHAVLDRQAEALKRVITETGAPCWTPDAPSTGPCPVH